MVTMPTNVRLRNLLGIPQRNGAPCTRRGHIQTMSVWPSRQPFNQLPPLLHCQRLSPLPQRLVHLPSWQSHHHRPLRRESYNCWSTAAVHPIWSTPRQSRTLNSTFTNTRSFDHSKPFMELDRMSYWLPERRCSSEVLTTLTASNER